MDNKNPLSFTNKKFNPIALVIFAIVSVVFFYLCKRLFFYDEDIFIVNPQSSFISDFSRGAVVKLTFLSDQFFYKTNSTGYHVTNILLHLINTFLAAYIFYVLMELTPIVYSKAIKTSYIFFFLFLLSPIHGEPLCYLLGRAGLIVTFFCLLSFFFFLKAKFKKPASLIISLFFFLVALFSYEISWTFPLIILCASIYLKNHLQLTRRQILIYTTPFFIVFVIWFLIKTIWFDQLKITPYGNDIFITSDPSHLFKNVIVLFFRNVMPPFENTGIFVALSSIVCGFFLFGLLKLKAKNKPVFLFCLFSLSAIFLTYLPAVAFGINSHNSESERYIYFSSVFMIMLLATFFSMITDQRVMRLVVTVVCSIYAYSLFVTINDYVQGGNFSKNYLEILAREQNKYQYIYLINQPSQYSGALLFRAYGDRASTSEKNITTVQDFMYSLYKKNDAEYITLSKKQISKNDDIKNLVHNPIDNLPIVFPEFHFNPIQNILINSATNDSVFLKKGNSIIIGLKLSSIYIFN